MRISSDFERAHQHPAGIRIELRADGAAPAHHLPHEAGCPADTAANEIAVAADVFGQGTQRDISAAFEWSLEHRTEHRIVDHDGRSIPQRLLQLVGDSRAGGEINKTVGRIGGRLDQDQPHPALRARRFRRLAHIDDIDAVGKAESGDAEGGHLVLWKRFGAAIEGRLCRTVSPGRRKAKSVVEIAAMPLAKTAERSA